MFKEHEKRVEIIRLFIREHVPRPKKLPVPRWGKGDRLRWVTHTGEFLCPMSLCPDITEVYEYWDGTLFGCVVWDKFTDPKESCDWLWGKDNINHGHARKV